MKQVLLVCLLLFVCGCKSMNTLYVPAKNMTKTIIPEYEKYVSEDSKLSKEEKTYRLNNAKAFVILVREYE